MQRRQSDLATLPIDLHVLIFGFLDPHDILQLRQTCKALRDATLQRIVWIEALRQICFRNLIFLPTFSLSKMSRSELEHAAIVPQLWLKRSSHSASQEQPQPSSTEPDTNPTATSMSTKSELNAPLLPHQITRRLHCPELLNIPMDPSECPGDFNSFYLVPGGRFLVTFSWNWFAVWDLGINPGRDTIMDFQPLDAAVVQLTGMELVHPTPDGLGLRIFVSANERVPYKDNVYESPVCLIYEIYPQNANPELELIARLETTPHSIALYSLSANRLVFLDESALKIWDYKSNAWASWAVERDYEQIIVGENSIMLLWHDGVDVWPIPTLTASTTSQPFISSSPPPLIEPSLRLTYPSPKPQYTSWCEGPCDWFSGTAQPFIYDLVCGDSATRSAHMRRYEVILSPDLKSGELVERGGFDLGRNSRRGSSLPPNVVAEEGSGSQTHPDAGEANEDGEDDRDVEDLESGPQVGYFEVQPSMFIDDKLVSVMFDSKDASIKVHVGSVLPNANQSALQADIASVSPATTATTLTPSSGLHTLLTFKDLSMQRPLKVAFCPISARLAYLDEHSMSIVDYLPKTSSAGVTWLDVPCGSREQIVFDAVLELCD